MNLETISKLQFLAYKWSIIVSGVATYFATIHRLIAGRFDGFPMYGQALIIVGISFMPLIFYKMITFKPTKRS